MDIFIRSDQYNFIKSQTQILINGHASANDKGVLAALRSLAREKVLELFPALDAEQTALLQGIVDIRHKEDAELFLSHIKPYVIPFPEVTEQTLRKLFPKAKKLKLPVWDSIDKREVSYLGWDDQGSNRKYIVMPHHHTLTGISGTFTPTNQKGICTLCNRHREVGLFMSQTKGSGTDTFIRRGNYVCQDSFDCSSHLTTLDRLHDFIERLN